ncbi:DUF1489 domain-containing protein [Sphingomonas sp.]|uniref:DUF1489 family protein n=1 Tax=Sphingomonas sp. TaxID=28214 RepID=UPI001EBFA1A2|nr:DUF1489 domain-containing protein [Sphingomonas sp.]MBX3593607.1 DUF1489 domain-containing protein [Sphingomonas sp.]
MPLHLTKVAFGVTGIDHLRDRLAERGRAGPVALTTRYLPKRHAEIAGGSLFWIFKHQLVARSPIIGFGEAEGGRTSILLDPDLVLVIPSPKRAHQGWRYLDDQDAPRDLGSAEMGSLPVDLAGKLAELGLV